MATFVKVGARVLNVDLVTDMHIKGEQVVIYFAAQQGQKGDVQSRMRTFKGEAAIALQKWLMEHWTDLKVAPDDEPTGADLVSF